MRVFVHLVLVLFGALQRQQQQHQRVASQSTVTKLCMQNREFQSQFKTIITEKAKCHERKKKSNTMKNFIFPFAFLFKSNARQFFISFKYTYNFFAINCFIYSIHLFHFFSSQFVCLSCYCGKMKCQIMLLA